MDESAEDRSDVGWTAERAFEHQVGGEVDQVNESKHGGDFVYFGVMVTEEVCSGVKVCRWIHHTIESECMVEDRKSHDGQKNLRNVKMVKRERSESEFNAGLSA